MTPAITDTEAYASNEHLGIPTGYRVKQTPVNTVRNLLGDVKKIGDSEMVQHGNGAKTRCD